MPTAHSVRISKAIKRTNYKAGYEYLEHAHVRELINEEVRANLEEIGEYYAKQKKEVLHSDVSSNCDPTT